VHDFVAAHGGRIEFVEDGLSGAHIRVVLPLQPAEPHASHGVEDVEKPYTDRPLQQLHKI